VSLNRTVSRGPHPVGYGITLDGEILHPTEDVDAVLERVGELFHLADEALAVEIERDRIGNSSCRGDEQRSLASTTATPTNVTRANPPSVSPSLPDHDRRASAGHPAPPEPATPKQVRYLQTLGKRRGLSGTGLDAVISRVVGSPKTTSDLTKREAGTVINHLAQTQPEASK
jgi:hypothetical protein